MSGLDRVFKFTEKQNLARELMGSTALHIMLFGGSRSGKTFIIVRQIVIRALKAPGSRHAILRFRFNHVKASIWYITFPQVMALCFPEIRFKLNKSDWFIEFPNGSQIWIGGLDDKERTEKILGQEYASILLNECSQISFSSREIVRTRLAQKVEYEHPRTGEQVALPLKMYYDENPPLKTHWTHRTFIEKRHTDPPYRPLQDPENYAYLQINPGDNRDNLPPETIAELQKLSPRARERFWEGKFGAADENALWTYEIIEQHRATKYPDLQRIVIAVDPSGTKGDEDQRSDHVGIVVGGLGIDGEGYVLEDLTANIRPAQWGKIVATAFRRWGADAVVAEVNYGGAMVENVIESAAEREGIYIPFKSVTATRGKVVRAEPFSGLYENGQVHHVGRFVELEDQLCSFTTHGYMGDRSPDRADACIWMLAELFPVMVMGRPDENMQTEADSYYDPLEFEAGPANRRRGYIPGRGPVNTLQKFDADADYDPLDWDG